MRHPYTVHLDGSFRYRWFAGVLSSTVGTHDNRIGMNDAGRGVASPLHLANQTTCV